MSIVILLDWDLQQSLLALSNTSLPIAVHAKLVEDFGDLELSNLSEFVCEDLKPTQRDVISNAPALAQPKCSKLATSHQSHHVWTPVVRPNPWNVAADWEYSWDLQNRGMKTGTSETEHCIVHLDFCHRPRHGHHCEEALYAENPQKPGYKTCLCPEVGCYIAHHHSPHKPQQSHHCGAAKYANHLQRPGYRSCHLAKEECNIVHDHSSHKPKLCHHFGEAPYDTNLQKPGYRYPEVQCRIVHDLSPHKPQHYHHFGEAEYAHHPQRPGYRTCLCPEVECCTARPHCPHKLLHYHRCVGARYGTYLQKPGCRTFLGPKREFCIVDQNFGHKPQHYHHFGEVLFDAHPQRPGYRTCLCPEVVGCTVHHDYLHKLLHSHHFGEAPYVLARQPLLKSHKRNAKPYWKHQLLGLGQNLDAKLSSTEESWCRTELLGHFTKQNCWAELFAKKICWNQKDKIWIPS